MQAARLIKTHDRLDEMLLLQNQLMIGDHPEPQILKRNNPSLFDGVSLKVPSEARLVGCGSNQYQHHCGQYRYQHEYLYSSYFVTFAFVKAQAIELAFHISITLFNLHPARIYIDHPLAKFTRHRQ